MHLMVELLASNDHNDLEMELNAWLRRTRPARIISVNFVADGSAYTYCILVMYTPRQKPLPK